MRLLGFEPRNPTWKEGGLPLAYNRTWSPYNDLHAAHLFTGQGCRYLHIKGILEIRTGVEPVCYRFAGGSLTIRPTYHMAPSPGLEPGTTP